MVRMVLQVLTEPMVHQVHQEQAVAMVRMVLQVLTEPMVHLVLQERLGQVVHRDLQGLAVHPVLQESHLYYQTGLGVHSFQHKVSMLHQQLQPIL